jgi:very-short-patch-repair endonuclease
MDPISFARSLRKSSSDAERRFWYHVRGRRLVGYKFRRQQPIGPYVVDFCCESADLIVELDGGQHAEQRLYDELRERYLREQGYEVLRFWDNDVLTNTDGVLSAVLKTLCERPHPRFARPLPRGEVKNALNLLNT